MRLYVKKEPPNYTTSGYRFCISVGIVGAELTVESSETYSSEPAAMRAGVLFLSACGFISG